MDDVVAAERPIPSTLHRRNSSTTTTTTTTATFLVPKLTLPPDPHNFPPTIGISASVSATTSAASSSTSSPQLFAPPDFEEFIISNIRHSSSFSYTSLRDLLPSTAVSVPSPTASTSSVFVIPIRNRLVKQAAWAYLRPMSSEPESSGRSFILCLIDLITTPIAAFFRLLTRSLDWMFRRGRVSSR